MRTEDQSDPDSSDNRASAAVAVPAVAAQQVYVPPATPAALVDTGVGMGSTVAVGGLMLSGVAAVNARGARRFARKAYRKLSKKLAL